MDMRSAISKACAFTGIGIYVVLLLNTSSTAQSLFPDTLWVPVIIYDYHADGSADFETCLDPNSDVGRKGMVMPTLDPQRKPIAVPSVACPTDASAFPCACHLNEWFRVSGAAGPDNSCIFKCDSVTDPHKPHWSWTNLVPYRNRTGEYTGPNFNANNPMANVIIYDSLCFLLEPNSNGVYQFADDEFFPINGRGFGNEFGDNFGFTMEMHIKFKYQKGLTFSFRGDDDVWAFINDRLVMDLGGLHSYMDGYIDLDTIASLVVGQQYNFDLFYAERHSYESHIHITSNVISASPNDLHISVFPNDTMKAGDTVTLVGTIVDDEGEIMPILGDSISWTQVQSNIRDGDHILIPRDDTTKFTGTVAYRTVGIIGTYHFGTISLIDTAWIYIQPDDPFQVDISVQNATALTQDQVTAQIDSFNVTPRQTIMLTLGQNSAYAYAVLRDRFGNFCSMAGNSVWNSQNPTAAALTGGGSPFEGIINRPAGVLNDSTTCTAAQDLLLPDTARIILLADTLIALRLVDVAHPEVVIDTTILTTDSSITVKVQGIWATTPGLWKDVTGIWTLEPADAVTFSMPLPVVQAGQWTIAPSSRGTTQLLVHSLNASTSAVIIVKYITQLRLVNIEEPNAALSTIWMAVDSTLTVKLQGTWSNEPDVWVDLTGIWSLAPSSGVTFSIPLPDAEAGQWTLAPATEGTTNLTVESHDVSETVHIIVYPVDRQGPYVRNAVYTTGPLGSLFDTLYITFSEPVDCRKLKIDNSDPAASFKVFAPGDSLKTDVFDGAYYMDRRECPGQFINDITIIIKAAIGRIVPGQDSLVLYGNTVDTAGNHPDTTRRGPIVYGPGAGISILPFTSTDPYASPMLLPQPVINRFGISEAMRQSKMIMIRTRGALVPDGTYDGKVTYGEAIIYDPVANLVARELPVLCSPFSDRLYYILWNGTNRYHRKVGSGAYLCKTSVRYANNPAYPVPLSAKFMIKWK